MRSDSGQYLWSLSSMVTSWRQASPPHGLLTAEPRDCPDRSPLELSARRPSAVSAPRGTLARPPACRASRHVRSCQRILLVEVAAREVPGVPPRLLLRLLRELGRVGGAGRLGRARAVRPEEALLA